MRVGFAKSNEGVFMARIVSFEPVESNRNQLHGGVHCGWRIFEKDGETILQLDTYGSADRVQQGTISQSIQLDAEGAKRVVELIGRAFPRVRSG